MTNRRSAPGSAELVAHHKGFRDGHPTGAGGPERSAWRWSWTIGRVFGIDLKLHVTFVLLLIWVGISHLAQGGWRAAAGGLALILSVFGVVVLHELSHALTARRFGINTGEITLLPIGGVASLERMPEKPGQELLVALAGPTLNLVLALALALVVLAKGETLDPASMQVVGGSFLTKLVWINVSLAVFNLLPAFPMDGGRVLRAALALRLPYPRATELAAKIGQFLAVLLAIFGLFANPILLLIALFVWMGAQQESTAVQLKAALADVPIRSAMITDFRALAPEQPLSRAADLILAGFQNDFPVIDDERLVGVLTRDDVVRGLAQGGRDQPVARQMRQDFATAEPGELLAVAVGRLREHNAGSLIVVNDGRVVGMITPENIGEWVLLETAVRDGRALVAPRAHASSRL